MSVPANIAEGAKRTSRVDYARFLNIAEGSAAEVECFLGLARDLGFVSEETVAPLVQKADRVQWMLCHLRTTVEAAHVAGVPPRRPIAPSTVNPVNPG